MEGLLFLSAEERVSRKGHMPPRRRDRIQAAGPRVSCESGSAGFFSLRINASLRGALRVERVQRHEPSFPGGLPWRTVQGPSLLPRKQQHQDIGKPSRFCQPLDVKETHQFKNGLKLEN